MIFLFWAFKTGHKFKKSEHFKNCNRYYHLMFPNPPSSRAYLHQSLQDDKPQQSKQEESRNSKEAQGEE
jgi:hypothetical protein